jgi:cytochrome c oxidase assembly protein subunit 15
VTASQTFAAENLVPDVAQSLGAVRVWLWSVLGLVFLMVLVGGATRLTESGLSITEWKPITGALLPLSEAAWLVEFEKYKQIPQYSQLFPTMTLAQFKTIFFWEWGHRLLGRIIGLAFALPLFWFAIRGVVRGALLAKLVCVLALGGLQGAVGWWMVVSGLVGRVEVAPERLAVHLLLASLTFMALIWIVLDLKPASRREMPAAPIRRQSTQLMWLVLFQIVLGALVAGSRAGLSYNTWPLMDGNFVPPLDNLLRMSPWWLNFLENITAIQFQHRMIAYFVIAFTIWHAWSASKAMPGSPAARRSWAIASITLVQAGLGIATLLLAQGKLPIHLALTHQAVAFILLAMTVIHAKRLRESPEPVRP